MKRSARGDALTGRQGVYEALQWIGRLFGTSPLPESPFSGVTRLTGAEREFWQSIQSTLYPGTLADADVACLLAHFGVDYHRNARRVLRGYTLRGGQGVVLRREQFSAGERGILIRIPGHAARLYHRWRDFPLLDWMLARRGCQADMLQAEHEALLSLWDDHWIDVLRAADHAGAIRITDALAYAQPLVPEPLVWEAYMRHLRAAVEASEPGLSDTALEIQSLLRQRGKIR